ncbi:P-loop containing nucleoside triphosphate hydrolase protein [Chytriomyces sp. MP71]|nr:P-loop containing nucleoside triphosphate hydrolase protein [Chytriomyces sp. MP71]
MYTAHSVSMRDRAMWLLNEFEASLRKEVCSATDRRLRAQVCCSSMPRVRWINCVGALMGMGISSDNSGAGKSTLLKRVFAEYPDKFGFSVSHTTRKPRAGEVDGKDYHFVTKEQIVKDIAAGLFIESAQFSGNYYGTSYAAIKDVLNTNKSPILDIDMQGVKTLQSQLAKGEAKLNPKPLFVFLAPPSVEELERRLTGRGTENAESLAARLAAAKAELEWGMAKNNGIDRVIVNDDVERAYKELKEAFGL